MRTLAAVAVVAILLVYVVTSLGFHPVLGAVVVWVVMTGAVTVWLRWTVWRVEKRKEDLQDETRGDEVR